MAIGFPPQTTYPLAIDSDRTLFLVYNTSESKLAVNNSAWSEEIEIEPVTEDQDEIWADTGFANISGELFYYDSVEKNDPVGSGALLGNIVVNKNGGIASVSVINQGSGYGLSPTIKVKGDGHGAKIKAIVEDGKIKSIKVINSGFGYRSSTTSFKFEGKIFKFKRCARNIGGKKTVLNYAGAWVRGFVLAEHHNQLVDTTIAIERYVFDLEADIALLEKQSSCLDDILCPNVVFDIVSQEEDNCLGTTVNYRIDITGVLTDFDLDFGDGNNTTSLQNGSHIYAPNTTIDPIITVKNDNCTVVQTPLERTESKSPEIPAITNPLIPIPPPPDFPDIILPDCPVQDVGFDLPQIIFPQIDITPPCLPDLNISIPDISIPSVISFGPIPEIPSFIDFGPVDIPSLIQFGPVPEISASIEFGPAPEISASIEFGPAPEISSASYTFGPAPEISYESGSFTFGPAPIISFATPPSFPSIQFGPAPIIPNSSFTFGPAPIVNYESGSYVFGPAPQIIFGPAPEVDANVNVYVSLIASVEWGNAPSIYGSFEWGNAPSIYGSFEWGNAPEISVNWGSPPTINVNVTCQCCPSSSSPAPFRSRDRILDEDFVDNFDENKLNFELENNDIGIPSEINIIAPEFPDIEIRHDIPEFISINSNIPEKIELFQKNPIIHAHEIKFINDQIIPKTIEIKSENMPKSIKLDSSDLPNFISLAVPEFQSIKIDASRIPETIKIVGMPDSIEVKIPSEITAKLEIPENLEIPLVYKGGPIPIQFDKSNLLGDDDRPCFALVPCEPKK